MKQINIQTWNEKQFRDSRHAWNLLLEKSNSDPLFMSWEWQHTWWHTFAEPEQMQLQLLAAVDDKGNLVGLAPLYLSKAKSKKIIVTHRLQFIGNCWHGKATMRTELLDFIAEKSLSNEVVNAFYKHINTLSTWDELILVDLKKDSDTYKLLKKEKPIPNSYYRIAEEFKSFFIETTGSFDHYIKNLGKNTRLSLFNRRKILDQLGEIHFNPKQNDDIESQFKQLNHLHAKRWGSPVFRDKRLRFNTTLAKLMDQRNALCFSILSIDNNPVSIQYNYLVNNQKYNIQAGFDESVHKKIALGYIHFGYEIEHACASDINSYDMLAGKGKNTHYKERLTRSSINIVNVQIIRNQWVKYLYKLYDYFNKA
ncbi:MAG: GNAT family N-acetyltransferase [Gammaproteobacteria bacterium]|nr:GNAT family N-acetyltransferase [Gammaproteobacteria bacterium]